MPVPKQHKTRAKRDSRRSQQKLRGIATVECPQCHAPKLPHRICPSCGYYDGKEVIDTE